MRFPFLHNFVQHLGACQSCVHIEMEVEGDSRQNLSLLRQRELWVIFHRPTQFSTFVKKLRLLTRFGGWIGTHVELNGCKF